MRTLMILVLLLIGVTEGQADVQVGQFFKNTQPGGDVKVEGSNLRDKKIKATLSGTDKKSHDVDVEHTEDQFFTLRVPKDLPSGQYLLRVSLDGSNEVLLGEVHTGFRGRCSFFSLTNALHRIAARLRFARS